MSHRVMSPRVEATLHGLHLNAHDTAVVQSCISNYTFPWDITILHWIVYRIINAAKGLFGASDWDHAKRLVQRHAREMANAQGLFSPQEPHPSPFSERIINLQRQVAAQALDYADYLPVQTLKLAYYENANDVVEEFRQKMHSIPIYGRLWAMQSSFQQINAIQIDLEDCFNDLRQRCANILNGMPEI